ncbi:hypothetical protein VTP01DRAFT_6778 [Rhizomucor pusillus]|uniref:uncharacterized protein n=1 Tax=Rhizomucor pusillus TaxID=4840 RepID=UPI003743339F
MEQSKSLPYIGCIIKEGAKIGIDIHEMHHTPRIWRDPEVFNPDRSLPGGEAESLSGMGMTWIPFSNGARQCIGMNFSLAEQRIVLPLLLRKYEWSLPEDSIHKDRLITTNAGVITPKDLKIMFRKRH